MRNIGQVERIREDVDCRKESGIRVVSLEKLLGSRLEQSCGLVMTIISKGQLTWQIPELGTRATKAGQWAIFNDSRTGPVARAEPRSEGLGLIVSREWWEWLIQTGKRIPAKMACLSCPQRDTSFFESGSSSGRMDLIVRSLLEERDQDTAAGYWMRLGWSCELLARILERPELQEHPIRRNCSLNRDKAALMEAARFLEANYGEQHSLVEIARRHHINEFKLKKGFREHFGTTVFGFLREKRMEKAREILALGECSVIEAANTVGYCNPSHFARAFREVHGFNPGELAR